jgi:hypothetical protein
MDFKYYKINKGIKEGRETAKQIRITKKDGTTKILKKENNKNTIHTYTFKNGMKRQWFTNSTEDEQYMVKHINEFNTYKANQFTTKFYFLTHPDDKIFYKYRYAVKLTNTTKYYFQDGTPRTEIRPEINYTIDRTNNLKQVSGTIRQDFGRYYTITETKSQSILICEKWVKWGMFDILFDDRMRETCYYVYDDKKYNNVVDSKSFLPLTDMRCCGVNNPFDDPYEPELKEMRDKRNEFKEQIAMEVFKPERVMRMIETFGDDWMEKV